jgi:thiamine biosynthesis lipoprotein
MSDRWRGLVVATAAGAMFCVALILLELQVRAGRDPAIGAGAQAAVPRQVIVRRVIVRRSWQAIRIDGHAIARPPGLRLDLGGTGKGHVADLVAERLRAAVVDCGGDIRVAGAHTIEVAHPLRSEPAARITVRDGAVATSSVVARAWTTPDGRRAHHLLDPSTGQPVWTGLLTATALAPTTLEAETLAKVALLWSTCRSRSTPTSACAARRRS